MKTLDPFALALGMVFPEAGPLGRYRNDPVAFVHDLIDWPVVEGKRQAPTPYQDEVLSELPVRKRVSVRGPHGLGKTALDSWVILWFALTRDGEDWKLPTTAGAWRQLKQYLWPEVHKWARCLRWDRIGRSPFIDGRELQVMALKLHTGEAFAVASDTPSLIEGAHADHLLYLFDESKSIPAETFDAAEGAFAAAGDDTTAEAFALATSTPGEPNGRFYDIQRHKAGLQDWWTRHVTLDEVIAAGRVSRDWAERRARQWGTTSALYANRVLGEFASSDEDGVIPLAWVEAANERWQQWQTAGSRRGRFEAVGVDVSRSSEDRGDRVVMALRFGNVIAELRTFGDTRDTMATAGHVHGILNVHRIEDNRRAVIDVIGVGAGVVDRLREQGDPVVAFHAAEKTRRVDRSGELQFLNKRAAAWWGMRELLDPANDERVALPPDDDLTGDLTAPHWSVTSAGKVRIEEKAEVRKRLGRSTDTADAVIQAFWVDEGGEAEAGDYDAHAGLAARR